MSISVRFKDTIRERIPEWITSICMVGWGYILLGESSLLWDQGYFHVLANIATQKTWAYITIIIGMARIVALAVNGAWRPSAHLRAVGALAGSLVWAGIVISYLGLDWNPPAIASKSALLALDLSAMWFAAGDAKLADLKARNLAPGQQVFAAK